ncbi:Ribosomal RNA small subunit methyltransferase E [hydrothermal vent metagenome]|uniref:16S rRNA (uracil(1498)-N(3))-methyltransferase n=1 Tax=hydrothermal vent metagenome TaxID=652676 RepID=A0A3B1EAD0_9ZZZZ
MQFSYHPNSGLDVLTIDNILYRYLFKARRHNINKNIFFRNLKDDNIYKYKIIKIDKKKADLTLVSQEESIITQEKYLHIGWCVIDPKVIEAVLPNLNELGVSKISFIYCEYSQKQFKLNFDRLNTILHNSSSQCGRSDTILLESYDCFDNFLNDYPKALMFNFSSNSIEKQNNNIETIAIGCEGGFSKNEINKISSERIVGINSKLILKSSTAVVGIASKILI